MLDRDPSAPTFATARRRGKHLLATAVAAGAIASSWSASARADQFVVFDDSWTFTKDLPDSHYHADPLPVTPDDLTSPVDYTGGSAWVYLEVKTKPTDTPTKFQVCFEANPTYACTYQSDPYTDPTILEWETPWDGFWSPEGEYVDWSQGINKIAVILKDTMNGKPSAGNVGEETAALYTPTDVRVVVTFVTPGGTYVSPTASGTGGAGGAGGSGAGGEPSTSDGGSSSDGSGASGATGPSAGPGGSDSGSGGAGAGGAPANPPADSDDGGCNVGAAGAAGGLGLWSLFAAAAAFVTWRRGAKRRR